MKNINEMSKINSWIQDELGFKNFSLLSDGKTYFIFKTKKGKMKEMDQFPLKSINDENMLRGIVESIIRIQTKNTIPFNVVSAGDKDDFFRRIAKNLYGDNH